MDITHSTNFRCHETGAATKQSLDTVSNLDRPMDLLSYKSNTDVLSSVGDLLDSVTVDPIYKTIDDSKNVQVIEAKEDTATLLDKHVRGSRNINLRAFDSRISMINKTVDC